MDGFADALAQLAVTYRWDERVQTSIRKRRPALASQPREAARELADRHGLSREESDALVALAPLAGGLPAPVAPVQQDGTVWEQEPAVERTFRGRTWSAFERDVPSLDEVIAHLLPLVGWVAARHRAGETVTSLDPANLLVVDRGEVVLLTPDAPPRAPWRAPEHATGPSPAGDVWVLGRLLLESLPPDAPRGLLRLAERACAMAPSERPPDAQELLRQLLRVVLPAERATGEVPDFSSFAGRREGIRRLVSEGRGAEAAEQARQLGAEEADLEAGEARSLFGLLRDDPGNPGLVRRLRAVHARSLQRDAEVTWPLTLLELVDTEGQTARYREGRGRLTLVSEPPGLNVELFRYVERDGRLWPEPVPSPGQTPLLDVPLEMGSYMVLLRGTTEVRYPVRIDRRTRWHGVAPEETEPRPVVLPGAGVLGAEDAFVPAGWFRYQDRWSWCEGFVVRKTPVRLFEYLEFLAAVRRQDDEEQLARCTPSVGPTVRWEDRIPRVDGIDLDTPVVGVSPDGARAFAAWRSARDGQGWRLPTDKEWEKAARGVDGRIHPWGDGVDASFAHFGASEPASVELHPADSSPYGVRGLAGNVSDWIEAPAPDGFAVARGGHHACRAEGLAISSTQVLAATGQVTVGFRLVRDL